MTRPLPSVHSAYSPATIKRNRIYFVLGSILVLLIGSLFAWGAHQALVVRSKTGSVFATYIVKHDLGSASVIDDASGFQGDFCVLKLKRPFSAGSLRNKVQSMAWQYYNLDGGTNLTIQYTVTGSHQSVIQASTVYEPSTHTLSMSLRTPNGMKSVAEKVDWPDNGDNS